MKLVLVTRPLREAQTWVRLIREAGFRAEALPLIEISPPVQTDPVDQAWKALAGYQAAMFVSVNAVDGFFARRNGEWPMQVQAWSTGPGTARALIEAGVPQVTCRSPDAQAAQFDSEALWQIVGSEVTAGHKVLIVRGAQTSALSPTGPVSGPSDAADGVGRDWLARQLTSRGVQVDFLVSYERRCPVWSAQQSGRAQALLRDGALCLFSSSEAIRNLQALLPPSAWSACPALATHPRIAQAARDAGFNRVALSRPALRDVLASIESQ